MEEEKKVEEVKTEENKTESMPSESKPEVKVESSSSQTTKKKNIKTWIFIGIAAVLIIAIILVLLLNPKAGTTKEMFTVNYAVYSENSLIGSGNTTVEEGKLSPVLGLNSNKLDEEISKMNAGEEKNITLEGGDAYGEYDPELKFSIERVERQNRTNEMNRTTWIDLSTFTQAFGEQPKLNQDYNLSGAPWLYKVVDLNSTHVKVSQEAKLNQEIPLGTFSYRVVDLTADKITLKMFGEDSIIPTENGDYIINFTENEVLTTFSPEIGAVVSLTGYPEAKVVEVNATHVLLDSNDPNAGKTINIVVNLIEIKKEISSGNDGPTMQFFIMSHCPYGTQMAKGVIPVWEKFISKANIELRFVSYTMHGAQEELDNNRLICIREEQSAKLINYLKCFVYGDGSETSSQACLTSTGIDVAKLDSCLASRVTGYMDEDKALNTQYGVQGSPTVVINGEETQVYPRDPQSVANALCGAFTSKPSECSFTFDTANPSPGFGGGSASSSGSAASCG